jgi:hypothetical protein
MTVASAREKLETLETRRIMWRSVVAFADSPTLRLSLSLSLSSATLSLSRDRFAERMECVNRASATENGADIIAGSYLEEPSRRHIVSRAFGRPRV